MLRKVHVPLMDVIIDTAMQRVTSCLAECGTNPDADMSREDNPLGFTLGTQNHTRWPHLWTENMLAFFRAHRLRRR